MKKLLILFIALAFASSFAFAETGVTASLEVGAYNVTTVDDSDMEPYVELGVMYENSLMDDALDVFAELYYGVSFGDETPMFMYFYAEAAYNLFIGQLCTLTFILGHEMDGIMISPRPDSGPGMINTIWPGVRFYHNTYLRNPDGSLGTYLGDFYVQGDVPVTYLQYDEDADTVIGLWATAGWESPFGLGLHLTPKFVLSPSFEYYEFAVLATYATGPVYCEVEVNIPSEIADLGVTVTPEVDFTFFEGFSAYLRCVIEGIGADGDMILSPGVGVRFSF